MKRFGTLFTLTVAVSLVIAPLAFAGNGLPTNGAHYNLNIIGVPKDKSASMDGNSGHRIFVPLWGSTQIKLAEGDFQVLDANGTDGSASFQLPNPDEDGDGWTSYSVFARYLGKPGGKAYMQTCATDPVSGELYCSIQLEMIRVKNAKFSNVTKYLLFVYADLDGNGTAERYPLFDDALEDYYWQYDNQGLKLVQLRFYEYSTYVPATP